MTATSGPLLEISGLTIDLGGARIVEDIGLCVAEGSVVALMGPNGCGKSTILRAIYRALAPRHGVVRLHGTDLLSMPLRRSAQHIAALAQQSGSDIDFTVEETVAMGRVPHSGGGRLSAREEGLIEKAMNDMGVAHLRERGVLSLSGGERQRTLIARALVQEPELLVLDEPTNHLDIAHQVQLLRLLRGLGVGVLLVLHDLNLAAAICDRIHFVQDGRIAASGCPQEIITPERVREIFGLDIAVVPHPLSGAPQVLYRFDAP